MRGNPQIVRLGGSRNPSQLGNPAAVANIRLNNIHKLALYKLFVVPATEQPFSSSQVYLRGNTPYFGQRIQAIGRMLQNWTPPGLAKRAGNC